MTPDQKRLADRILKLLALANSTTFVAEAQSARSMAEQLMQVHNISVSPGKPAQSAIECRKYIPFAKGMRWEGIIACALADLCSCKVFFRIGTLDCYTLVGSIGNLDVLDYKRIAAWLQYKASGPDSFNKFCYGFAQALGNKIATLVNQSALEKQQAKLRLWYETNVLDGRAVTPSQLSSGRASSDAGLAAGRNASLHRGALGQPQKLIG